MFIVPPCLLYGLTIGLREKNRFSDKKDYSTKKEQMLSSALFNNLANKAGYLILINGGIEGF
jgi:hypothetical protein